MKRLVLLAVFVSVIIIAACSKNVDTQGNVYTTQKTVTGETKTTIETKEGQTVTIQGTGGSEWCSPGSDWKMTAVGGTQDATATWKVIKLETSGEYAGMCHVLYTLKTQNGQNVVMDYWFAKDGKSGYYEANINGQKVKQSWSS